VEIFFLADWDFDLLGDAIPEGHGRRGRPPHVPTLESRQKCVLLAAVGKTPDEIAAALSITAKTLRKHYSRELREQEAAKLKVEGKLLVGLVREVDKGSVAANKELAKRLEKAGLEKIADRIGRRAGPEKVEKLGKKEAAKAAANEVAGRYAPRPGPGSRLVN
jgi:predicted transcriptional regulator